MPPGELVDETPAGGEGFPFIGKPPHASGDEFCVGGALRGPRRSAKGSLDGDGWQVAPRRDCGEMLVGGRGAGRRGARRGELLPEPPGERLGGGGGRLTGASTAGPSALSAGGVPSGEADALRWRAHASLAAGRAAAAAGAAPAGLSGLRGEPSAGDCTAGECRCGAICGFSETPPAPSLDRCQLLDSERPGT